MGRRDAEEGTTLKMVCKWTEGRCEGGLSS